MVEDGYYPSLIVCRECRDERHPQERLPKLDDPVTIFKPAPDDVGEPPELSGEMTGNDAHLSWTEAEPINARIDSYDLYRRVQGDADWTLVVSLPITYDVFMAIEAQTLEYDDSGLNAATVYEYFVEAVTDPEGPDTMGSNIVELTTAPGASITPETGELVLTEELADVSVQGDCVSPVVNGSENLIDMAIDIDWTPSDEGTAYEIWYLDSFPPDVTLGGTPDFSELSLLDTVSFATLTYRYNIGDFQARQVAFAIVPVDGCPASDVVVISYNQS